MCQATGISRATVDSESPRKKRTRVIVTAQDAKLAVNDRVNEYPERQFVRRQPVKNAGNKAYSHRNHCMSFASNSRRRHARIVPTSLPAAAADHRFRLTAGGAPMA